VPPNPPHRRVRQALAALGFTAALLPTARADLGVVVADPTNLGASRYTVAGHSLVYLSGVCAVSPIQARLCNPGEQGSVVTMYPNFHESQPWAWNIVPLSLYLEGSLTPDSRLLYASTYVKQSLELHTRQNFFQSVCADDNCPQLPHSYWRDMIAATADRDLFVYAVHTTRAQDQVAVDWLNRDINRAHYNPLTNNCANFAADLVNTVFPHSVHRDLLNDVGMMGPKSAARSFTRWAQKQPELGFYTLHFAQQPGPIRRSGIARSGTETVIHMKKYLIPTIVLGDWELPTSIFASYILTGRFSLYKEFARYPSTNTTSPTDDSIKQTLNEATHQITIPQPTDIIGTPQQWSTLRTRFAAIQSSPEAQSQSLPTRQQFATATASVDAEGYPWLTLLIAGHPRRVGIRSDNLLAPESDPQLAFQLMLHRIDYALNAKDHQRETMPELLQDWSLLEQTQSHLQTTRTATSAPPPPK
jgi:hypothetical protein